MATFVKKNFDQAKGFYNKLSTENKQTIISEIASTQERLRAFELKQRDSQRNLKHLLSLKKEKLNNLPSSTRTDMIINEFISRPNNQISKEINERMKLISNDNIMNIQNEILKKKELVIQYRKFLDEYVKKIYGVEKNVIFSIEYKKSLDIVFSYDEDSGAGKSNMKLLIYYYFLLITNHNRFNRQMDMMLVDTDFTDSIDSLNLYSLLEIMENNLVQEDCQMIFTLRDDMGMTIEDLENHGWVIKTLSDAHDGYLFKEKLELSKA
ncbi:DUF2326 domain-containing protein [Levilactobacillus brevis]|uniref:DUF2326 domain-containing protein n=1 Tax=Levilactobacillus brevis TaxID=1580 RepID=UPI0021A63A08|nr:DUF2326 domain-containing protein [Levilactobacillus brevis]